MSEFNNNNEKNNNHQNENHIIEPAYKNEAENYSSYNVSQNVNYDNDNYSVDEDFTADAFEVNPVTVTKKNSFGKKVASYVAVGLVCSIIGGAAAGIVTVKLLPKSGSLSSPLYYTSSSNNSAKVSATSASSNGALTVAEIAKKVGPAVVGISTKTVSQASDYYGLYGDSGSTSEGYGSGIIFNDQGYILTNYHVVSGATTIKVVFNNKKEVNAKVVNYDSDLDLAVIKVTDSSVKMPGVAELGNSKDLQVGDTVVAIGNPLGQEFYGTVTSGIVSATNRVVATDSKGSKTETYIQTDAAINAGNSGGPLINSQGQVIGINSAKISSTNTSSIASSENASVEGIGFAIPIDTVKPKISTLTKQLIMLGISCTDVSASDAKQNNVPQGIRVEQVTAYSNADKAGIQAGDIITKFNGKTVKTTSELNTIKSQLNAGDSVQVEVYRDGETKTLTVKLSE